MATQKQSKQKKLDQWLKFDHAAKAVEVRTAYME